MMSTFAVHVAFYTTAGGWSKAYTYKSDKAYDKDAVVLVPTGAFFSLGKVTGSETNYKFNPAVKYKEIVREIEVPKNIPKAPELRV